MPEHSFCGVSLPLPTPRLQAFVDAYLPLDWSRDWSWYGWAGYQTDHLPVPPPPEFPPVRLGTLTWPRGASRWAVYYGLVTASKLDEIRAAVGSANAPKPLVMDDGRTVETGSTDLAHRISPDMYLLRPVPLSGIPGDGQLFLLVLVDERYFWALKQGSISSTPGSWSSLFSTLAGLLGVSIATDTISADYQSPSARWKQYQQPLPAILDAACAAVGHRLVRKLDGTVVTQRYATAIAAGTDQWPKTKLTAGYQTANSDIARAVPASVNALFRKTTGGVQQDDPYVVNKTLASLSIPEYGGATGMSGRVANVIADYTYDGTNAATAATLATRAATDWYGWELGETDATFPGIVGWTPTGLDDAVEWTFTPKDRRGCMTRVRRGHLNWYPSGSWLIPTSSPPPPAGGCKGPGWLRGGPHSDKALRVTFEESLGLCDCTPAQAAGTIWAIWKAGDATTDTFEIARNLEFCCGCASGEIIVDHAASPQPTAKLTLTFYSCLDDAPHTLEVYGVVCEDGFVTFEPFGLDLCGEPGGDAGGGLNYSEYPCTSLVRISAECTAPPTLSCACRGCLPAKTPLAFRWADYVDGFTWYLNPDGCTFASVCPSSPALTYNEATDAWTLSAHGHAWSVAADDFDCCTGGTLALVGGPVEGVPDTVTVAAVAPQGACASTCCDYADMPGTLYVTSAHFGTTRAFVKSVTNEWKDADLPDPGLTCDGPPPSFGPEHLTLDPATCKFTTIWAASCCGGSPAPAVRPVSLDPFLVEFDYHDDMPLTGCPSDDTITISETPP